MYDPSTQSGQHNQWHRDQAVSLLENAIRGGLRNTIQLESDEGLHLLHEHPKFSQIVRDAGGKRLN